jgi:hypothetical protein
MSRSELQFAYDRLIVDETSQLMNSGDTASLFLYGGATARLVLYGGDAIKIKWAKNLRESVNHCPTFDRAECEIINTSRDKAILLITLIDTNHGLTIDRYRLDIFASIGAVAIKNPPEIIKDGGLWFAEETAKSSKSD